MDELRPGQSAYIWSIGGSGALRYHLLDMGLTPKTEFNQLAGANQHVGNFPGVTVDRKDGVIRNHPEAVVTDLPGIYSLSPYSSEEIVTKDFLMDTHPDGIINIVDATNIERNLFYRSGEVIF